MFLNKNPIMLTSQYSVVIDIIKNCKNVSCFGTKINEEGYSAFMLMTDGAYYNVTMSKEEILHHQLVAPTKQAHSVINFEEEAKIITLKNLYNQPQVAKYFSERLS